MLMARQRWRQSARRVTELVAPPRLGRSLPWLLFGLRDLLDVVDAAWSGEPFDVTGRHGRWRGHVTPAPFGHRRPELVMGAHGPRGLELAGQRADLWLSDPQRHVDVAARLAGRVRSAAEAAGRTSRPSWWPGGPGHEATLTALARFGEEVIGPMGEGAQ